MIKDIIKYNNKKYQLSTTNLDGMLETMVFPIEYGVVSGKSVYTFRTFNSTESQGMHKDILNHPEKYITDESPSPSNKEKKFNVRHVIDVREFQHRILDCVLSDEIDKMLKCTTFADTPDCKQAMMHGMIMASMLTCQCKLMYIPELVEEE